MRSSTRASVEATTKPQPGELALNESLALIERAKQEWEATADSLPQLICLLDDQKRVLRANRAVETWGLAQVLDVKGREAHGLLHPKCTDPACYLLIFWDQAWEALLRGQPAECEAEDKFLKRYLRIQVRPIPAQANGMARGSNSFATVVVVDITEHKQAETALRRAREELERRVEERTAQLEKANQLLREEITERVQAEEALQRRNRELELLNLATQAFNSFLQPDRVLVTVLEEVRSLLNAIACSVWLYEPETEELVCRQATGPQNHLVRGWRLKLGQGIVGWVAEHAESLIVADARADERYFNKVGRRAGLDLRSIVSVPLRAKQGVIGVLQVLDIEAGRFNKGDLELLEPLAASAAIAIQNARLYDDLQGQMQMLKKAQAQLVQSEKMAALGRLTASIAHEINNPLQSIQNSLLLLKEELEANQRPDELDYCLGVAEDEIGRIAAIVHRMRDFYWPAPGTGRNLPPDSAPIDDFYRLTQDELQSVDLHATLENVLSLANKQMQHSAVRVECHWAPELPSIQGNPDYLKQVFLNLTLNAVDAMATEGGTLVVSTDLDQLHRQELEALPAVRIEFSDTGEGIPPEVLSRLYEPFTTTKAHGSGFGLFVSYKIIEAHHGRINVQSHVGLGSTITIHLPVDQPQDVGVRPSARWRG